MKVDVRFFAAFQELVGEPNLCLELSNGATIKEVVQTLSKGHPKLAWKLLTAEGKLVDHVNLFLNGRNVLAVNGLDTQVKEGDVLAIFPPIGGG